MSGREKWWAPCLGGDSANPQESPEERYLVEDGEVSIPPSADYPDGFKVKAEPNLLGSRIEDQDPFLHEDDVMHLPCIDIDHPCEWVPSETPGHGHLYIDKPMKWSTYRDLLWALHHAGLVEKGYVQASLKRQQTFVASKPWKYDKYGDLRTGEKL